MEIIDRLAFAAPIIAVVKRCRIPDDHIVPSLKSRTSGRSILDKRTLAPVAQML